MSETRITSRTHPLWIAGLAMLLIGVGIPRAHAERSPEPGASIKVRFADLNLQNPAGVDALYKRIERAARLVCDLESSSWDPSRLRHRRECVKTAVTNAVNDVNNTKLTAMHRVKQGAAG